MNRPKDDHDRTTEKALKKNPNLAEGLQKAEQAWDIAFQIINLREQAGLTQKQLAELVGTKQSNIARMESSEYTGYTFKTLEKVTKALKAKLEIRIVPDANSNIARLQSISVLQKEKL
jgi:ribosome-binding protein aMBF1 (putative translation factor)